MSVWKISRLLGLTVGTAVVAAGSRAAVSPATRTVTSSATRPATGFGRWHTFQGGCAAPGDEVADTPPEAAPASGCPASRDLRSGGGTDPIHNYMDYVNNECMDQFTPGQKTRATQMWNLYRA